MKACDEEKLLGHLGVVLYEYLGEEYPEVLGSILAALKVQFLSKVTCCPASALALSWRCSRCSRVETVNSKPRVAKDHVALRISACPVPPFARVRAEVCKLVQAYDCLHGAADVRRHALLHQTGVSWSAR